MPIISARDLLVGQTVQLLLRGEDTGGNPVFLQFKAPPSWTIASGRTGAQLSVSADGSSAQISGQSKLGTVTVSATGTALLDGGVELPVNGTATLTIKAGTPANTGIDIGVPENTP